LITVNSTVSHKCAAISTFHAAKRLCFQQPLQLFTVNDGLYRPQKSAVMHVMSCTWPYHVTYWCHVTSVMSTLNIPRRSSVLSVDNLGQTAEF